MVYIHFYCNCLMLSKAFIINYLIQPMTLTRIEHSFKIYYCPHYPKDSNLLKQIIKMSFNSFWMSQVIQQLIFQFYLIKKTEMRDLSSSFQINSEQVPENEQEFLIYDYLNLLQRNHMNQQNERFTSKDKQNSFNPSLGSTQGSQLTSTSDAQASENSEAKPFLTITHTRGYQMPRSNLEPLLAYYSSDQITRLKSENAQKYNMSPQSVVYRFPSNVLEILTKKYPTDFSNQMHEEINNTLPKLKSQEKFFDRLALGTILYWSIFRGQNWFKLTGNSRHQLIWMLMCFTKAVTLQSKGNDYLIQNAFVYNKQFQDVIKKYGLDPLQLDKIQLVS